MAATMRSLRIGGREFRWGARTYVMGIVNVTPDSFSGDGVTDLDNAVSQARQMEQDGADLIDIGGGATPPRARGGPRLGSQGEPARGGPGAQRAGAGPPLPGPVAHHTGPRAGGAG